MLELRFTCHAVPADEVDVPGRAAPDPRPAGRPGTPSTAAGAPAHVPLQSGRSQSHRLLPWRRRPRRVDSRPSPLPAQPPILAACKRDRAIASRSQGHGKPATTDDWFRTDVAHALGGRLTRSHAHAEPWAWQSTDSIRMRHVTSERMSRISATTFFPFSFSASSAPLRGILLLDHNGRLIVEIEAVERRAVVRN